MSRASHRLWSVLAEARERLARPPAPPAGLRVLCYHSVGGSLPGDPYGLSVDPAAFRAQMALLASGRFGRPVSLGGARLDGSPEIAVTFDDGFMDTLTAASPVLVELGLPFTLCAAASYVLNGLPGYLDPGALKRLSELPGAEVGAHGSGHFRMAELTDDDLERELRVSRELLQQTVERRVDVMSWPHGSASRRAASFAAAAGFRRAACSLYGVNEPAREPLLLKRVEITGFDSEADFLRKCSGGWDWFARRQGDPAGRP